MTPWVQSCSKSKETSDKLPLQPLGEARLQMQRKTKVYTRQAIIWANYAL